MSTTQPPLARILVVEDNIVTARVTLALLESDPTDRFDVTQVGSLADAQKAPQHRTFGAILLDLGFPDSSEMGTVRRARVFAGDTPIVILTANEAESYGLESVRMEAQDYVLKSHLTAETLCRTLRFAIERQKLLLQLSQLERTHRRLLNRARDPICTVDAQRRVTYANATAIRFLWPEAQSYFGKPLTDPVSADFEATLVDAVGGHDGTDRVEAVLTFVDCDGTDRTLTLETCTRFDGSLEAIAADATAFTASAPAFLRQRLQKSLSDDDSAPRQGQDVA